MSSRRAGNPEEAPNTRYPKKDRSASFSRVGTADWHPGRHRRRGHERAAALRSAEADSRSRCDGAAGAPGFAPRSAARCRSHRRGQAPVAFERLDQSEHLRGRSGVARTSAAARRRFPCSPNPSTSAARSRTSSLCVAAVRSRSLRRISTLIPIQLLEAKALGASAALLIVRALSPELSLEMADAARALGLEMLVEMRDEGELERALASGAAIIGVNNRNLETLEIDPALGAALPLIPSTVIGDRGERRQRREATSSESRGAVPTQCSWGRRSRRRRTRPRRCAPRRRPRRDGAVSASIKFCGLTRAEDAESPRRSARRTSA